MPLPSSPASTAAPRLDRFLTHERVIWAASLLAIVLCLPALDVGLLMDDYAHRMIMLRVPGSPVEPLEVFANFYGEPEVNLEFMNQGITPWWTVPDFRLAFSRVLSAISMWIDYQLWPSSPMLMHLHSLLWLGAMVAAAGLAYRRLWGAGFVAGLAVVLFALDDAHAMPTAWIANRNALIATALGLLAIAAHERWRRRGWKWGAVASGGCLALALLSGEAAVGAVGYLGAWAFTMEDGWRRKIGSLLPGIAVALPWAAFYKVAGLGGHGSGLYIDPAGDPLDAIAAVLLRGPQLMMGQWSPVPSEMALLVTPAQARALYVFAWAVILVVAAVTLPLLRRDRVARFLGLGMVFSLLPATATFSSNRLLTFAGFGAMGLLAMFLASVRERRQSLAVRAVAVALVITHVPIAALFTPVMAYAMKVYHRPMEAAAATLPSSPDMAERDVLILTTPDYLTYVSFAPPMQHAAGKTLPRRTLGILSGQVGADVTRVDAQTLRLQLRGGLFDDYLGRLFRSTREPLQVGDKVGLETMSVEVTAVEAGQPSQLVLRFPVPVDDPSLVWMRWEGRGYVPFTPPAVGETITVPPPPSPTALSMPG